MNKQICLFTAMALLSISCNSNTEPVNDQTDANSIPYISDFPTGSPNNEYARYFSGRSWLAPLSSNPELNVPVSNVTFEPGCRNNWHSHTGGQILIAVGGAGYYQEYGKAAVRMQAGDVIDIAPNVVHWHGAAPDSWFSHLAITCNPQLNRNTWLEPVSDQDYIQAVEGVGVGRR